MHKFGSDDEINAFSMSLAELPQCNQIVRIIDRFKRFPAVRFPLNMFRYGYCTLLRSVDANAVTAANVMHTPK